MADDDGRATFAQSNDAAPPTPDPAPDPVEEPSDRSFVADLTPDKTEFEYAEPGKGEEEAPPEEKPATEEPAKAEAPPAPTIEERFAALEKEHNELKERVAQVPPPAPQKTPEQIDSEMKASQQRMQEDNLIGEANRLQTDQDYQDRMIAEHGMSKVEAVIRNGNRLADRRQILADIHAEKDSEKRQAEEQKVREQWDSTYSECLEYAQKNNLDEDALKRVLSDPDINWFQGFTPAQIRAAKKTTILMLDQEARTLGVPAAAKKFVQAEESARRIQAAGGGGRGSATSGEMPSMTPEDKWVSNMSKGLNEGKPTFAQK